MGVIATMNRHGDTPITYPTVTPGMVLTAEQQAAVDEAERVIREARLSGATVFAKVPGTKAAVRMDAFDATLDEYTIVPIMAGG